MMALRKSDNASNQVNDVVIEEDSQRTPFSPPEPKIMILRRPQASLGSESNGMLNNKPRHPVKTLEQRQAEYAQARLRILGDTGGTTNTAPTTDDNKTSPKPIQQKSFEQREADYAAARLRIMGSSKSVEEPMVSGNDSSIINPDLGVRIANQSLSNSVGVLRTPKGPDGTSGFSKEATLQR